MAAWLILLLSFSLTKPAGAADSAEAWRTRGVERARAGEYTAAVTNLQQAIALDSGSVASRQDLVAVQSWSGKHPEAVAEYEGLLGGTGPMPAYVRRAAAASYRQLGRHEMAQSLYRALLAADAKDADAVTGLALSLAESGHVDEALRALEPTLAAEPNRLDLLFTRAQVYWRARDLVRAVQAYDAILALAPGNAAAINQRTRMLSDLGAVSLAQDVARTHAAVLEKGMPALLEDNMAARRIVWREYLEATNILGRLMAAEPEPRANRRARFDMILALAGMERMSAVVALYEDMVDHGVDMPYWVTDAAASAYLFLEDADRAIALYKKVIEQAPSRFESRMGLYSALVEAGDYREAGDVLRQLEKETAEYRTDRGLVAYNWNRQDATVSLGWWLAYQDRLDEADEYFDRLRQRAPANRSVRTAQGQVRAWRGWPRDALEEMDIVITGGGDDPLTRPDYVQQEEMPSRNGRVSALRAANRQREARDTVEELLARNPGNRHTQRLAAEQENLARTRLDFDYVIAGENPGVDDEQIVARLTQPIIPELDVFAQYARYTTDSTNGVANSSQEYERIGAGVVVDLLPSLTVESMYSEDINEKNREGVRTRVEWRPTDHWIADALYDSFTLDVPLRARAAGIDGERGEGSLMLRTSESFDIRTAGSVTWLSDNNEQRFYGFFTDNALFTRAYVKSRLLTEVSRTDNLETNVVYFSPDYVDTAELTHRLDHTIYRRYERYFTHRLYLGVGLSHQADYNTETIYDARYEHDYGFTDRTILLWGLGYAHRYYDGEPTDVTSFYVTFRKVF